VPLVFGMWLAGGGEPAIGINSSTAPRSDLPVVGDCAPRPGTDLGLEDPPPASERADRRYRARSPWHNVT
jgi:hypothetical protein